MQPALLLVVIGIALQVVAWMFYRRPYRTFWVSRGVWHHLYPRGVMLTIVGVLAVLAGGLLYVRDA